MSSVNRLSVRIMLCVCLLIPLTLHAQNLKQIIKGTVLEKVTQTPLSGAAVVLKGVEPNVMTTSDVDGHFRLDQVPVGRYEVEIRYLGFKTITIPEVLVSSAKEVFLNVEMQESIGSLKEVVIQSHVDKGVPLNSMAMISARSFNVEETRRYAGGMDDPARLVSAFAGVSAGGNNQDNAIVIRGNAPKSVLWRIEGVDVPNPSHFSGGNVAGGGFVTAISSQMLGNSDFYTGAFPAEYGNALGGVFDIKLRTGNNEKHEQTIQAGMMGIDVSAEGPLAKTGKASYLFNYRYSTFGLLSKLGLMPTEQTPVYQDLSFKLVLPTKKMGVFSLWGLGGIDQINDKAGFDSTLWETDYDRVKNNWDESFGAVGLSNNYLIGSKTIIRSSLAATTTSKDMTQQRLDDNLVFQNDMGILNKNGKITLNMVMNHKFSSRLNLRAGINQQMLLYSYNLNGTENKIPGTYKNYADDAGHSFNSQVYTQAKYDLSQAFSLSGGLHIDYFDLNKVFTVDPRFALNWNPAPRHSISLGYGKHSQLEELNIYFIKSRQSGQDNYSNKKLDFSHAHHLVLGYNFQVNESLRLKVEPYFQYLFDVPGIANSSFSMINFKQDLTFQSTLENNSSGRNVGLDVTLERFLKNNFYYLVTASLFDSKYKADDGIWRNTRYNKKCVMNFLVGKEFEVGKQGNNLLGVNLRGLVSGGDYATPLNQLASDMAKRPIYDENKAFSQKGGWSKFLNFSITYRVNKVGHSSVFAFQLNNVLGEEQFGDYEFNYAKNACVRTAQVYRLPLISYKIEF